MGDDRAVWRRLRDQPVQAEPPRGQPQPSGAILRQFGQFAETSQTVALRVALHAAVGSAAKERLVSADP